MLNPTQPPKIEPLSDVPLVRNSNTALPADIPPQFCLLVSLTIVALIGLGMVAKLMQSVAVIVTGFGIIVAILAKLGAQVS